MSDPIALSLIDLAKEAIRSSIAGFGIWFSYRAALHAKEALTVSKDIQIQTNGLTEKLVNAARDSGNLQGRREQRAEERE